MKKPDQKGIIHIVPLLFLLTIAGVAIWFFLNRGGIAPSGVKVPIPPSQLMPLVPGKEARTTICKAKKEELFAQACQSKFDAVDKEDSEKIVELFALIEKIKNDKNISDYERLLLSQVVFAALPIGDNPENPESFNLNKQSLLSRLKDYLTSQITVYAQGQTMSEEEFKELMKKDLQNMVDSLPKGDNAWVINIMVSKYSWKDGKSQPLYSHQYMESFDPFPNNPNVNKQDINYHVQSAVGSKASGQTVDVGSPSYKGTSDMIGYSFTIQSWKSQEYSGKDGPVEEKFLVGKNNFSESFYQGEYYLNNLLEAVKMPSTKRTVESSDENAQKTITCEEWKNIIGTNKCKYPMIRSSTGTTSEEISRIGPPNSIWCGNSKDFGKDFEDYKDLPVDYRYDTSEEQCIYDVNVNFYSELEAR